MSPFVSSCLVLCLSCISTGNSECFVSSVVRYTYCLLWRLFSYIGSVPRSIFATRLLPSHFNYYWIVTEQNDAELARREPEVRCISQLQLSPGPPFLCTLAVLAVLRCSLLVLASHQSAH